MHKLFRSVLRWASRRPRAEVTPFAADERRLSELSLDYGASGSYPPSHPHVK